MAEKLAIAGRYPGVTTVNIREASLAEAVVGRDRRLGRRRRVRGERRPQGL